MPIVYQASIPSSISAHRSIPSSFLTSPQYISIIHPIHQSSSSNQPRQLSIPIIRLSISSSIYPPIAINPFIHPHHQFSTIIYTHYILSCLRIRNPFPHIQQFIQHNIHTSILSFNHPYPSLSFLHIHDPPSPSYIGPIINSS